jgi:hypothetical protein
MKKFNVGGGEEKKGEEKDKKRTEERKWNRKERMRKVGVSSERGEDKK